LEAIYLSWTAKAYGADNRIIERIEAIQSSHTIQVSTTSGYSTDISAKRSIEHGS